MDQFQQELAELKGFIADLKADRAATKEKERRESWTKYVSLCVVIIAVFAATASQMAGGYGGKVQISQVKATDEWGHYQAKSIKQNLYEVALTQMAAQSDTNAPGFKKCREVFDKKIAAYENDKAEIFKSAKGYEKDRDESSIKGHHMSLAVSFFSVSIAIASICLVTKKKPLWFVSLILAGAGIFKMVLGW
jgi:hypothetical protein